MRRLLLLLLPLLLLLTALPAAAQLTVGPRNGVRFDYSDAEMGASAVARFELCIAPEGGQMTCTSLPDPATLRFVPTTEDGGPPAAGFTAYRTTLPPLNPGIRYTAGVRACNASCGLTGVLGAMPLAFRFVIEPAHPVNQQLITMPRGGA